MCHPKIFDKDFHTLSPFISVHLSKQVDSSLLAYTHQHAWLLFSSLSLTLANILYIPRPSSSPPDADYIKAATELHKQCIELVTSCLMLGTTTDEAEDDDSPEAFRARQEEAFAIHSQERIMGLLGAMLPADNKVGFGVSKFHWYYFLAMEKKVRKQSDPR